MESRLPTHIQRLISDLEAGADAENALQTASNLASYDSTLLNVLVQLGFNLETSSFVEPPDSDEALNLLCEEYSSPMTRVDCGHAGYGGSSDLELRQSFKRTVYENQIDQFATCSELGLEEIEDAWSLAYFWEKPDLISTPKPYSKPEKPEFEISPSTVASMQALECESDSETTRSTKGLRHLTSLVKQVVGADQATSYKEVAVKLIKQLIVTRGPDRVREEKNVRRRVYDAINVLIAAGVLEKEGKSVTWKENLDSFEVEELKSRHSELLCKVKEKRSALAEILRNYVSIKHLLDRNHRYPAQTAKISFPFIIVSTTDSEENSVSIFSNKETSSVKLQFSQPMSLFGDVDILTKLKMYNVHASQLRKLLPSKELVKYFSLDL